MSVGFRDGARNLREPVPIIPVENRLAGIPRYEDSNPSLSASEQDKRGPDSPLWEVGTTLFLGASLGRASNRRERQPGALLRFSQLLRDSLEVRLHDLPDAVAEGRCQDMLRSTTLLVLALSVVAMSGVVAGCTTTSAAPQDIEAFAQTFTDEYVALADAEQPYDSMLALYAEDAVVEDPMRPARYESSLAIGGYFDYSAAAATTITVETKSVGDTWFAFQTREEFTTWEHVVFHVVEVKDNLAVYHLRTYDLELDPYK
jgi:predicted small secreted protein